MKFLVLFSLLGFASSLFAGTCEMTKGFEALNDKEFKGPALQEVDPAKGLKYYSADEVKSLMTDDAKKGGIVLVDTRPASFHAECAIVDSANHPFTAKNGAVESDVLTKDTVAKQSNRLASGELIRPKSVGSVTEFLGLQRPLSAA